MAIDLRTCKEGDILISKHGTVLTYVRPLSRGAYYDHVVEYPNGSYGSRCHDGMTFRKNRKDTDEDIVKIRYI